MESQMETRKWTSSDDMTMRNHAGDVTITCDGMKGGRLRGFNFLYRGICPFKFLPLFPGEAFTSWDLGTNSMT